MRDLLLVIDMQNDFIDGALGTREAVAIVPKVEKKIREFQGTVLFTRDTHFENYMETQEGHNLPVPHCIKGSEGWEIRPCLEALRTTDAIDKLTFGSSELGPKLVEMNAEDPISSVTLIGLCTDICVISNAMIAKAFLPEVPIIVDAACCAGVSPATHDNALAAMEVCQIKVINKPVTITWLGHACFRLDKDGYSVILDPFATGSVPGIADIQEEADAVFCSHGHFDHSAVENVTLKNTGAASPFTVTEINTWHDDVQGAKRGPNTIRIFDDGNVRIAHFGDIGCELTPEQIEQLKNLDVAMIPVGGFFTIDGAQAAAMVQQIQPKMVIPMHYRNDVKGYGFDAISEVDSFTRFMGGCTCLDHVVKSNQVVDNQVVVLG